MTAAAEYAVVLEEVERDRIVRYVPTTEGAAIPYARVVELWRHDPTFRSFCSGLLAGASFEAFRWETPAFSKATADRPFEFVLVDAPGFASRPSDAIAFEEHFTTADVDEGIVTFANLRGDSTLVAPSPRAEASSYGHLAAFVRSAPVAQVDALWRTVGDEMAKCGDRPIWLSTAGGGVAWLHVRLDTRPKYYAHAPYKLTSDGR